MYVGPCCKTSQKIQVSFIKPVFSYLTTLMCSTYSV